MFERMVEMVLVDLVDNPVLLCPVCRYVVDYLVSHSLSAMGSKVVLYYSHLLTHLMRHLMTFYNTNAL